MKIYTPKKLNEILYPVKDIEYKIIGNADTIVTGFNDYQVALSGDITWVDFEGLYRRAFNNFANVVIVNKDVNQYFSTDKTLVVTRDPLHLFDRLLEIWNSSRYFPRSIFKRIFNAKDTYIHRSAVVDKSAIIGKHVSIGKNVRIFPNVTIYDNVIIGDNVTIQANSVIGSPPFAHIKQHDGRYVARKTWGDVIILDNVEIAALNTIDRGITGSTIIGSGTKTCGQVHIGHDTWIGENCYISGGTTISGYVRIKSDCQLWGQSGIASSVKVEEGTILQACGIITKDVIIPNQILAGYPAEPKTNFWKKQALLKRLINEK